mgnify:CR=1 FL=1
MATRVLGPMLRIGALDDTPSCWVGCSCAEHINEAVATSSDHQELARETAAASIVLLKNEPARSHSEPPLPIPSAETLRDSGRVVALLGTACDSAPLSDQGQSHTHPNPNPAFPSCHNPVLPTCHALLFPHVTPRFHHTSHLIPLMQYPMHFLILTIRRGRLDGGRLLRHGRLWPRASFERASLVTPERVGEGEGPAAAVAH